MLAMQVLSMQLNDETNLRRLIALTQQQKLKALNIMLSYPLTSQQLVMIPRSVHGVNNGVAA
ncbi:MAG: hypothetical protein ACR5LD_09110 [Symbiopectobacterium sp.]